MAGWVCVHPRTAGARQPPGAEREDGRIGRVNVVHHDIQMDLLR
jgi:hypothetical protein